MVQVMLPGAWDTNNGSIALGEDTAGAVLVSATDACSTKPQRAAAIRESITIPSSH